MNLKVSLDTNHVKAMKLLKIQYMASHQQAAYSCRDLHIFSHIIFLFYS